MSLTLVYYFDDHGRKNECLTCGVQVVNASRHAVWHSHREDVCPRSDPANPYIYGITVIDGKPFMQPRDVRVSQRPAPQPRTRGRKKRS